MSPENFVAELVSNRTILFLSWIQLPIDQTNGIILGYQLSCIGQDNHSLSNVISGTTAFLHAIHNNTHYTCQVCAYTSVGCGPVAVAYVSTHENCKYRIM